MTSPPNIASSRPHKMGGGVVVIFESALKQRLKKFWSEWVTMASLQFYLAAIYRPLGPNTGFSIHFLNLWLTWSISFYIAESLAKKLSHGTMSLFFQQHFAYCGLLLFRIKSAASCFVQHCSEVPWQSSYGWWAGTLPSRSLCTHSWLYQESSPPPL